jgi:carotenoid cleavage dioxygenase
MGDGTGNTTNHHVEVTFAIVEAGGFPVELTDDLETVRRSDLDGTLDGSFTAHPKRDPVSGELHAMTYYWEWDHVRYVVVVTDGRVRRTVQIPVADGPMIHDCAITERYVLSWTCPSPSISRWMSEVSLPTSGTRDIRHARAAALRGLGGPDPLSRPCYVFHPLNATTRRTPGRPRRRPPPAHARPTSADPEGPPALTAGRSTPPMAGREQRLDDHATVPRTTSASSDGPIASATRRPSTPPLRPRAQVRPGRGSGDSPLRPGSRDARACLVPRALDAAEDDGWCNVRLTARRPSDVVILNAQDFT